MASRAELRRYMLDRDARTLDAAASIIKRLKVDPEGTSRAAFVRTLQVTARMLRLEAGQIGDEDA